MRWFLFTLCALLGSCASQQPYITNNLQAEPNTTNSLEACKAFFQSLDAAINKAGVRDGQWHIVSGYPFLRTSRFLSAYRHTPMTETEFSAWLDQMQKADISSREIEISNLAGVSNSLKLFDNQDTRQLTKTTKECSGILRRAVPTTPSVVKHIRENVIVPDDYQNWKRWFGIYPISSQFVSMGINDYYKKTRLDFRRPMRTLTSYGLINRYIPVKNKRLNKLTIGEFLSNAAGQSPLGIPEPSQTALEKLYSHYAPVLEIDVSGRYDQIGTIQLGSDGIPTVLANQPAVYGYHSFTHYRGSALLQLNYVFWFSQRPPKKSLDMLSGYLDGITFRITLSAAGQPIMYDAIHNCGCYHMFFPAGHFVANPAANMQAESPLVPQHAPTLKPGQRMVIRISSQDHMIQRLYADTARRGNHYQMFDYNTLRSLPMADKSRHSMFNPNGIVEGTQRPERFLLWPMGVPSPGAMRQRGRHATAFLGKRHFDDGNLLENLFIIR